MFFVAFGLLVVLAVATLIGGAVSFVNRTSSRVAGELARIRAAGEPASVIELEEHYRLPPDVEDTTELWLDATRRLKTEAFETDARDLPIVGLGRDDVPRRGKIWDDLEAAEQLLWKYREPLQAMHEAAELGGAARYPVDFSFFSEILFAHTERLWGGARLLSLETHVHIHQWNSEEAARSIRAIFMLARSLEREPTGSSLSMRLTFDDMARQQIKVLLPSADFSDMDLAWFQDILRAIDYHDGLYQSMLGERVMGIDVFENPDFLREEVRPSALWPLTQASGFAFYLEHANRLVVAAQQPWPQALQGAKEADAMLWDRIESASFLTRKTHVFPAFAAPTLSFDFTRTANNVAWNGAADTAIAVELYRRRHGDLPQRLEELVPDFLPQVPIDPFDGQPLRYVVRKEEYVVYSVGYDRVDDGGRADPQFGDSMPDVVFRVLRSP